MARLADRSGMERDLFGEVSGKPALVVTLPKGLEQPRQVAWFEALIGLSGPIHAAGGELFVILQTEPGFLPEVDFGPLKALVLADPQGQVALMPPGRAGLFLLDANQRVIGLASPDLPDQALPQAVERMGLWRRWRQNDRQSGAPALLIPDLIPPDLCKRLCDAWLAQHHEGAVSAGGSENFYDPSKKRNQEHVVSDRGLLHDVTLYLVRRLGPELAKVFAYHLPYRFENFIVLGYEVERHDFFGLHRDRYRPEHPRRFAMSLNLNDDYEGGTLRFPEYSDQLYRPPPGGACVFSCSLLHEALPVTRGRRLAMTTFILSAEEPPPGGLPPRALGQGAEA
ncbi:MAG: hypothetical protein Kilf2KO_21220 [Rhodospirillales bacterium]